MTQETKAKSKEWQNYLVQLVDKDMPKARGEADGFPYRK